MHFPWVPWKNTGPCLCGDFLPMNPDLSKANGLTPRRFFILEDCLGGLAQFPCCTLYLESVTPGSIHFPANLHTCQWWSNVPNPSWQIEQLIIYTKIHLCNPLGLFRIPIQHLRNLKKVKRQTKVTHTSKILLQLVIIIIKPCSDFFCHFITVPQLLNDAILGLIK